MSAYPREEQVPNVPKPTTKSTAKSKPAAKSSKGSAAPKSAPKGKPASSKLAASAKPATKPAKAPAKPAPKAPAKAPDKTPAKPAPKSAPPKPAAKPSAKPAAAPAAKAPTPAPSKSGSPASKPEPAKPAAQAPAAPANANANASGKKGITIVAPKPIKKPKVKALEMPVEPLIKPGMKWKPLIASGPKAPPSTGIPGVAAPTEFKHDPKARLSKKELDHYRKILLDKRFELIGDINNMEDEALRQNSGSLSTLPQHMAEQGSDTFEQSLSLDLAQVDRHLLREIEAALVRIEHGTYGVCERTGKRISAERLAELPWARYSIEAAREMERRPVIERGEAASDDEPL